ncbi:MAG: DUF4349 domain-containing protein [Pirellulales bacterium]|nr:DUF4349 domain-containing protein [Pirellulales bacterium]
MIIKITKWNFRLELRAAQVLLKIAGQYSGYIAGSNISGSPGSRRSGSWEIRIPVEHYHKCLEALRGLGELRSESSNSKDISEEYYDLNSRIRNKQKEEERLLKLLEDATGKLQEILTIERELSRVRGEIKRMQGRFRVINDLTAMTTVNLSVEEIKYYDPPKIQGYSARVSMAFQNSLHNVKSFAESLSIAAAALAPWAVVFLPPAVVVWIVVRRRLRRK